MGRVKISKAELREALQRMVKIGKPNKASTAFVWSLDGQLYIELPSIRVAVPIEGGFESKIEFNAQWLSRLWMMLPEEDLAELLFEADTVRTGSFSFTGEAVAKRDTVPTHSTYVNRAPSRVRDWLRDRFLAGKKDRFEEFAILGRPQDFIDWGLLKAVDPILADHKARIKRASSALKQYGVTPEQVEGLAIQTMSAQLVDQMEAELR